MAADNEIKVLLTADLAGLQAGMQAATESVTAASEAITASVEESAAAVETAQEAIVESATSSAETVAAAMEEAAAAISMSYEEAFTSVLDSSQGMLAAAEAQAAAMEAQMAQAAVEAAAFNATVQAKIEAQTRLNVAFASGVGGAAAVAEAEAALDQAMAAGAISASEYAGYVERLNIAEMEMAASTEVATEAIVENAAATEAGAMSSRTSYEISIALSEILSGNFGRLKRTMAALANSTGILRAAMTGLGPAILGVTGVVAAFGVAAVKGAEEQERFNGALLMTGDAAGLTGSDFEDMARRVGEASGSFGNAKAAMLAIVESGKITASQVEAIGIAAQDMSKLTGDSVDQSVDAFVKLQEKPVQAVVALNDKYHFLTQAVFDQIEALQQQGNTEEAARVATETYSAALAQRTSEMESHLGTLARAWASVKESASFAWDAMLNIGKEDTLNDKVSSAQTALETFQSMGLATFNEKAGHVGWEATEKGKGDSAVEFEIANLKKLQDAQKQAQDAAKGKAAEADRVKQYTDDASALDKWNAKLKDHINLQEQIAAKKAEVEKVHKEDPNSAATKGYTFDASGAVTGGEQWAATVAKLTKEYSNAGSEARKAAQEARKAAAEQMNDLEMVRAGTAANTDERIRADADVLASATRLYGANSSQQKAALAQFLTDEKAYDASVVKAREDGAKQQEIIDIDAAQSAMAVKRQQIETAFALGDISRKQELAALQAANEAEYQEEMKSFAKELALLDAKSKAAEEVEKKIGALQKTYSLEAQKSTDDQLKAMQQSWQKALKPIDSAFQQSINGMIQGTQTFKKGLENIFSSIVASYAQMGIQTVISWIANEGAKGAATAEGVASRNAIEATGAAQSKALDAATGKSQITSAAATGAAKAYQAIVGIPYVGPVLAPIAAGVAFAGIEAFSGMISSARGGWERVPFDGAMTELHKDEMVLPAHIANPMRQMAQKGGQGGGNHYHINAMDMRSFTEAARRNQGGLAKVMKQAARNGHFSSRR